MAITALFKKLAFDAVEVGDNILSDFLTRAYQATNALYESATDDAAFGKSAGSQLWEGHDHGPGGGPAIQRGCLYSMDGGANPLFTLALTAKTPQDLTYDHWYTSPGYFGDIGRYFVSPRVQGPLEVWLCYDCVGSEVKITPREAVAALTSTARPMGSVQTYTLDNSTDSAETETYQWVKVQIPCFPGELNGLQITCEAEQDATFQVYSVHIAEVEGVTVPIRGSLL